ncbi:HEXXH motif-containing protein [Pseudonocardia thermophila]|jgi:hypothetical protein|uniref:HEXXH motif-containing protein n=1 Tax=Pseudonocardia thermophila TaxID=1848 RepID=A0A1M6UM08_PSETH|nr:HEXXH motif-containing putative peptide modification protein [Pseudonocardia thermophila]SHK70183.1 HEXXH motif-containing protein [Pseudonocardia thermophila]
MSPTAAGLRAAHARFGSPEDVLRDRRVLYRALAAHLGSAVPDADAAALDDPLLRGRLGEAFASGRGGLAAAPAGGLGALVDPRCTADVAGWPVRVASTPAAPQLLRPALARVHGVLRAQGDHCADPLVLCGTAAQDAFATVLAGVRLAVERVPELATDLLPHVALFVVLDRDRAGRLGSASDRDHPGMVVLPAPASAVEAAEAFVHEGAHQKFFDLALTHEVLGDGHWTAPAFRAPWAAPDAPEWPLEQLFAAWHAYTCLTVLAAALTAEETAPGSLLPHAAERAAVLAGALADRSRHLGRDGAALLAEFTGCATAPCGPVPEPVGGPVLAVHRSGDRALVLRAGSPPELVWRRLDEDG